jgi:hypothetical protein
MWNFISANWVWLLFAGGVVVMHLGHGRHGGGHGGHGSHGGHSGCGGGHAPTTNVDEVASPELHRHSD